MSTLWDLVNRVGMTNEMLVVFWIIIVQTQFNFLLIKTKYFKSTHLSWRPFRLWKMFTRIYQWILGSLNGLLWKSIVPKILTGSFLRKSIFFNLGATKNFFWPEKTLFGIRNPNFGGVILLKLFDPSYSFKAIQGQKWLFLIFPTSK